MFDHVTIRVTDRDASEAFYDTVLFDPDGNNIEVVNHNRG